MMPFEALLTPRDKEGSKYSSDLLQKSSLNSFK
jgi:hypothetical protein